MPVLTLFSLFGATVTSWKVNGKENIFLSKKAVLDGSVAVCLPDMMFDAIVNV